MKKGSIFSASILICLTMTLKAGGDITAELTPVEPIGVKKEAVPVYIGIGSVAGRYFSSNYEDVTYGTVARVGYDFNQYLGVEARYLGTFWDEGAVHGQGLEHVGLFLKPMLPVTDNINTYGLLGYGWTQTTGINSAIDDNGFSAGLGMEYNFSDKREYYDPNIYYPEGFDGQADQEMGWGFFMDYQRLLIQSDIPDLDVVSAGITYDF